MAAKKKDGWKESLVEEFNMHGWKERLVEEFNMLNECTDNLEKEMLKQKYNASDISFSCTEYTILEEQLKAMLTYRECLKKRAIIQHIDLDY